MFLIRPNSFPAGDYGLRVERRAADGARVQQRRAAEERQRVHLPELRREFALQQCLHESGNLPQKLRKHTLIIYHGGNYERHTKINWRDEWLLLITYLFLMQNNISDGQILVSQPETDRPRRGDFCLVDGCIDGDVFQRRVLLTQRIRVHRKRGRHSR